MVISKCIKNLRPTRWLVFTLIILAAGINAFSKPVSKETAQQVAEVFFNHKTLQKSGIYIKNSYASIKEGIPTYYAFNCDGGGWAIIAADDISTPILAYSSEGSIDENTINPLARLWLEDISNQIVHASRTVNKNPSKSVEWQNALTSNFKVNNREVSPLLSCTWNQTQGYNNDCPADPDAPNGYNGHTMAGCVAIAMAQIMKYHSFPLHGTGSHSYFHSKYGTLSADFGNTQYNWDKMSNKITAVNADISQFVYQCGVSVNMDYEVTGSGAYDSQVPVALVDYFGYSDSIRQSYRPSNDSIGQEIWVAQLKLELDNKRPVYYSGSNAAVGHAFVCDGYDNSFPTKFHFNWGWGGAYDGYFAIGALNAIPGSGNYTFNNFNYILTNIKPGYTDPDQILCKITSPEESFVIQPDSMLKVSVVIKKGTSTAIKLYIDNYPQTIATTGPYTFKLPVKGFPAGKHVLKVIASNTINISTDSVNFYIYKNTIPRSWKLQQVIPSVDHVNVSFISIPSPCVMWATLGGASNLFTMSADGGTTWNTGNIFNPACDNLTLSNVYAVSDQKAFACFNPGNNEGGAILVTNDQGKTWDYQPTADFSNSWANWVHFFDADHGVCMGDSYLNQFVIYTTNDGGNTWNKVSAENLPSAFDFETGLVNSYEVYQDAIWFGTNSGRFYKSADRGLTWTVTDNVFDATSNYYVRFKDNMNLFVHKLGRDKSIYKSKDGGISWTKSTESNQMSNLVFIPGTYATWINFDDVTEFSTDDDSTFSIIDKNIPMNDVRFVSPNVGWGGAQYSAELNGTGIYKWNDHFPCIKKYKVNFHVRDENNNSLPDILINGGEAGLTDNSGNAMVQVTMEGNPYGFNFTNSGYLETDIELFVQKDTTLQITLKKSNNNNSVVFFVNNLANIPQGGISIYFNNSIKNTDNSGKAEFFNLTKDETYLYSALKGPEYVDYGNITVTEKSKMVMVTLFVDSFYQDKQIPDVVFPNPASDVICVISNYTIDHVKLFKSSGELLFEAQPGSNVLQIPSSAYRNGLYLLEVIGKAKTKTYKVVVNH